jgi:hypothetical protein
MILIFCASHLSILHWLLCRLRLALGQTADLQYEAPPVYLWIYPSICLSVYLSFYLCIFLSAYPSVCLSTYLSVCLSHKKIVLVWFQWRKKTFTSSDLTVSSPKKTWRYTYVWTAEKPVPPTTHHHQPNLDFGNKKQKRQTKTTHASASLLPFFPSLLFSFSCWFEQSSRPGTASAYFHSHPHSHSHPLSSFTRSPCVCVSCVCVCVCLCRWTTHHDHDQSLQGSRNPNKRSNTSDQRAPVAGPAKPQAPTGPGQRTNANYFFAQFVAKRQSSDNCRSEDPHEALLRQTEGVQQESEQLQSFTGAAYSASAPHAVLASTTLEAEIESDKKKRRKDV